ncbi:MAG: hypothetical protein HY579_07620 [Nitrospinae bacterium]|nr:hypothetical protein [Nitrospinota bacterium]
MTSRKTAFFVLTLLALLLFAATTEVAEAIPAFARRYNLSCVVCHVGFPKLNGFGEQFAANGYQLPDEDMAAHGAKVGDEKLLLLPSLPLAVRAESFFRARADTRTHTDLEAPSLIKIISGAPLKKDIAYYFTFLAAENGDIAGVEDAFLYFNNIYKNADLDVRVGQFQLMDIVFPREHRLTFQDFTYYVTAISDSGFRLTYDRIAEISYNFAAAADLSLGIWGAAVNGNGIGVANSDRNFDSDNFKDFYGRILAGYGEQRVGFYGYSGRENNAANVRNEFFRAGPDFTFTLFSDFKVWGNFLIGEDDNPGFSASVPRRVDSWGALGGVTYPFKEDWILSVLYNNARVYGRPVLNAETLTGNISYYIMRNFKVMFEVTGDLQETSFNHPQETHTGVAGFVLAF